MPGRVMIVDDDEDFRELARLSLGLEGIDVETAPDGVVALERLRHEPPPGVIFVDIRMPRMNGLELISALRRDPARARIPVVVLSGDTGAWQAAAEAGAVACLRKPVDVDEIVAAARRHGVGVGD